MNFNGLTKEAKVELSHILRIVAIHPRFEKHKELLEMVRECLNSEIRTHLANNSPQKDITTKEIKWHRCSTDCKGELNLAAFENDKDLSKLDSKTISKIVERLNY